MKFRIICIIALTLLSQQDRLVAQYSSPTVISTNPDGLVDQSRKKFARKDFTGAMNDLNQAIKANPKHSKAYNGRGLVKHMLNDLKGSMMDYDMAISLDPKYARAYSNRGALKLYQDDLNSASIDLNSAIALDPSFADAYNNRGLILSKLGKRDAAIKDFQKAARLYEAQGDKESARQSLETIKKLNRARV